MSAATRTRSPAAVERKAKPRDPAPPDPGLRERARRIAERALDFVGHPSFEDPAAAAEILADPRSSEPPARAGFEPAGRLEGLSNRLAALYEAPLLTPAEEAALFRRMNYLLFRADRLRSRLAPERPDPALVAEHDRLLAAATAARDRIARANLRLVAAVARTFAGRDDPFDDLVGDGHLVLLEAIAKFDSARGFRFSTYATTALRRSFARRAGRTRRRLGRVRPVPAGPLNEAENRPPSARAGDEGVYETFRDLLDRMPDRLGDRERAILEVRFGLGGTGEGLPLHAVATRLGVCKERVRQLQNRAIGKLRDLAAELEGEPPATPASVP